MYISLLSVVNICFCWKQSCLFRKQRQAATETASQKIEIRHTSCRDYPYHTTGDRKWQGGALRPGVKSSAAVMALCVSEDAARDHMRRLNVPRHILFRITEDSYTPQNSASYCRSHRSDRMHNGRKEVPAQKGSDGGLFQPGRAYPLFACNRSECEGFSG